jgi:hypothetical protein
VVIYTINTSQYSKYSYDYHTYTDSVKFDINMLPKNNTYIVIICEVQECAQDHKNFLETCKEINLLYKSPMAVNKNTGHGTKPRNTVYVFHLP